MVASILAEIPRRGGLPVPHAVTEFLDAVVTRNLSTEEWLVLFREARKSLNDRPGWQFEAVVHAANVADEPPPLVGGWEGYIAYSRRRIERRYREWSRYLAAETIAPTRVEGRSRPRSAQPRRRSPRATRAGPSGKSDSEPHLVRPASGGRLDVEVAA